ncbi:unnamed protein product [Hapterophycus canaliculatus]
MYSTRFFLAVAAALCMVSTAAAFVAGGTSQSCVRCRTTSAPQNHVQQQRQQRRQGGVRSLRAASDDGDEGGGFVNPYTAFRKWQMDLIESKAKNDDKYPEAFAGLMKERGMTKEKAERLAKLSVSDPILYAIERRREANEINNTPMDYSKISGFFPMEWIMSGDFGWGFNKKKKRLAEEEAEKANKKK